MVLGIGGFNPSVGDLVKVVRDSYEPIAKGTISRIMEMSQTGEYCFIMQNPEVPINIRDLELVAYRIGNYEIASSTRTVKCVKPRAIEGTNDKS